jgi:hypothetical protein
LLSFVASTAAVQSDAKIVDGFAAGGRSARAIFPMGRSAFIAAASAAAAAKECLHMVLFCGERPLPAFLPQDENSVVKVPLNCCMLRVLTLFSCSFLLFFRYLCDRWSAEAAGERRDLGGR